MRPPGTALGAQADRHRLPSSAPSLLVTLLPIAWMATSAFKPDREINRIPPTFLPHAFTLDNFPQLFTQFNFGLADDQFDHRVGASSWCSAW